MTMLGGHFSDLVVRKIKEGKVFRGTGASWDLKILQGSMRKDINNEDLHMFASNLTENRLNFTNLSNESPKGNIKDLQRSTFSLCVSEWKQYAESAKIIVGRIILEFLPQFKFLKGIIPDHIPHQYRFTLKLVYCER